MNLEEKRAKIKGLRVFHEKALRDIGVPEGLFIPRMAYKPKDHNEVVVSFFASELKNEKDIYTEFVSREFISEDPDRTLWKWRYNPHWQEEYSTSEDPIPSSKLYYVPVSELLVIARKGVVKEEKVTEPSVEKSALSSMLKKVSDEPFSSMTIRDFAAIVWKEECSEKKWLNELISQTK